MSTNADVIRDLIHKENEMINHRMNWFLILQGFMFAGIAFAWDKGQALSIVFSSVGMLSALSVGVLLRSGIKAIEHLEQSNSETNDAVMGKGKGDNPGWLPAPLKALRASPSGPVALILFKSQRD